MKNKTGFNSSGMHPIENMHFTRTKQVKT